MREALELHVPITPTPVFLNRIHYLAASLRVYGGALAESRLVVTVGADEPPLDIGARLAWARRYPIAWRWVDRERYRRHSYFATRLDRFTLEYQAQHVLMLDADVVVVGPFDEILEQAARQDALLGLPAHLSPVRAGFTWEALFAAAGVGPVRYTCEHSGFGVMFDDPAHRFCPPYFNLGVLLAPAHHWRAVGRTIYEELAVVEAHEPVYRAQMSLTLALRRHRVPWGLLEPRFHLPNDPRFLTRWPHDFADPRLVHYLRKETIDKDVDFETPERVAALFDRAPTLDAANRMLLERLRPVHALVVEDLAR